jgi:hypothetical protein
MADRRALIEALAHVPGMSLVLGALLQVAPGQVETDGVAIDAVQRPGRRDVGAAAGQRDDQFDLVLQVVGRGG